MNSNSPIKVIIEAQHAVGHPQPRGVGHYSINLIHALLRRRSFEYGLTFFDYSREAGNRQRAEKLFAQYSVPFYECNELDYRIASRSNDAWEKWSYNQYTKTNYDIYHFMNIVSLPLRITGKVLVTVLDLNWCVFPEGVSGYVRGLVETGLERLNILQPEVIAISQSAKDELLRFSSIPEEKINVILISYDEHNLYPDPGLSSEIVDGDYIFFVGTIESKKNVCAIADAFFLIADKCPALKLVIAGKVTWEDMSHFYQKIDESKFRDRVIMPGYITTEQKRRLYSNALCFVFPSICEGFGIPVLEAMACGCPVITADNTSLPEVGGEAAVYVHAHDTELLAFEMERIIASEGLRKEMTAKGFAQAKKFSWDKTAEQVEKIYRRVANT